MAKNPWLEISVSDYVNHMSSPEVKQYQLINRCFKSVLTRHKPKRIFVPGCTIGNGFEHISWEKVESVVALDINCEYLNILKDKFKEKEKLKIINEDITTFDSKGRKFDLIFAALLFEYVDLTPALEKIKGLMDSTSVLFSMIQLPGKDKVTRTKYKSLEKLSPVMHLITGDEFQNELKRNGFIIKLSEQKVLKRGKSFLLTEAGIKS
jgi:SAM-dependent methyltransferase